LLLVPTGGQSAMGGRARGRSGAGEHYLQRVTATMQV